MGMRYAGFMAAAREDRLTREAREAEEAVRDDNYQRQLERDKAAHQRQLELLDIRQKNALKLNGIAASRAQKKIDAALRRKVDALITTQGLPDTPEVRGQIAAGIEIYGADGFMKGLDNKTIRISRGGGVSGGAIAPSPEVPEVSPSVDTGVGPDPTVDMNNSPATADPVEPSGNPNGDAAAAQFDGAVYDMENKTFADAGNPPEGMIWDNDKRTFVPVDETSAMLNDSATQTPTVEQQTEEGLGSPTAEDEGFKITYNNLPELRLDQIIGLDANGIDQFIRMAEEKGYSTDDLAAFRTEADFVRKTEVDTPDSFATMIGDADTFGKLNALQAQLDTQLQTKEIDQTAFDANSDLINKAVDRLIATRRVDAEKDGGQFMYFPMTKSGAIGADGSLVTVRDGQYFDPAGNVVDVSGGKLLPPENFETFVRNYNVQSQKIADIVADGTTAVQALSDYRRLVIDSPQGLNNYISVAGKLVAEANSIKSALEGITRENALYSYSTFENAVMSAIRDLSAEDARIARAQLRAAYTMAAFSGSSGQALSDNELVQNLRSVGQGLTDPRKVVGLINDNIDTVVTQTEQRRTTKFDSFIADDTLRNTMSDTPIGMNFTNYLDTGVLDEDTRRQYLDALGGKVDYAYGGVSEAGNPTIATMTFDEFKADLKNRAPEIYDQYTEDKLREFFQSEGGQL